MTYAYDNMNRISTGTGMSFTWDDNGDLLTWDDGSDEWAYRYDPEDRLINVKKNGAAAARYTYDAGGRRVRSWDAARTTDYVYSGLSVVDEVRGGVHERHVYAGGMHLASISSGTVEYYHVDHLGSTRLRTDASGGVTYGSNYEPYGLEYGESGSEEFRYTGKQEDPTGLYYYGARYYDPVTGRFITRDSVFGDLSDPQSLNRYVYCRNNPHKYLDPDGHILIPAIIVAIGTKALIGGVAGALWYGFTTPEKDRTFNGLVSATISGAVAGAAIEAVVFSAGAAGATVGTMMLTRAVATSTGVLVGDTVNHMMGGVFEDTNAISYYTYWGTNLVTSVGAGTIMDTIVNPRLEGVERTLDAPHMSGLKLGYGVAKKLTSKSIQTFIQQTNPIIKLIIQNMQASYNSMTAEEQNTYWVGYDAIERNK